MFSFFYRKKGGCVKTNENRKFRRVRVECLEDRVLLAVTAGSEGNVSDSVLLAPQPLEATQMVTSLTSSALLTAITRAADGDTICFKEGLSGTLKFNYALTLTKSVTIDGGGVITLDGGGAAQIFNINAAGKTVTLKGLTFTNGYADESTNTRGGALYVTGVGLNLTIIDCAFTSNVAGGYGGAIYMADSALSATISNTTFTNNAVTFNSWGSGGAVYVGSDNTVMFRNVTMTGNTVTGSSAFGGAINLESGTNITIEGSLFSGNTATATHEFAFGGALCGGLYAGSQTLTIKSSIFENNGVFTSQSYSVSAGGTICVSYGDLAVMDSTFSGNVSSSTNAKAFGGAIVVKESDYIVLTGSTFVYNNTIGVNAYGGAFYVMNGDAVTVSSNQFAFNEAQASTGEALGGAIYTGPFTYDNGKGTVNMSLDYDSFSFNRAVSIEGSAVRAAGGAVYSASGYALSDEKKNIITSCYSHFESNAAVGATDNYGGGFYNGDSLTLQCAHLSDNYAGDSEHATQNAYGGGVYNTGSYGLTVINSAITGNEANSLSMSACGGGFWNDAVMTIYYSTMAGNKILTQDGTGLGGGIYDSGHSTVIGSIVATNISRTTSEVKTPSEVYTTATGDDAFAFQMSVVNTSGNVSTGDEIRYTFTNANGHVIDSTYYTEESILFNEANYELIEGSIAVDMIDMTTYGSGFTDINGTNFFDKRGINYRRVVASVTDAGCYEKQASDNPQEAPSAVVTTLYDIMDGTDGLISLREAILYVTAYGNDIGTTITFDTTLTGGTMEIDSEFGELYISSTMTIDAPEIIIDALGMSRVFHIGGSSEMTVRLAGLTIRGGLSDTGGAGVYIEEAGSVTLENCLVTMNIVNATGDETPLSIGGGIANTRFAELVLTGTTISENSIATTQYALGGGVYNSWGILKMTDCTVSRNTAWSNGQSANGGGIYNLDNNGSYINQTIVSNNISRGNSAFGGGLATKSGLNMTIARSQFLGNQTQASASGGVSCGGGIYAGPFNGSVATGSNLYISYTVLSENLATTTDALFGRGTVMATRGGGLYNGDNLVSTLYCDIMANKAVGAESNEGGGIYNGHVLWMEMMTLTGNEAGTLSDNNGYSTGGGMYNTSEIGAVSYFINGLIADNTVFSANRYDEPTGGGIANFGSCGLVVYNSTLTGNRIVTPSGIDSFGGGVYDESATTFLSSIVVGNSIVTAGNAVESDVYTMATGTSAFQLNKCLVNTAGNFSEGDPIVYSECSYYQTGAPLFTDATVGDYTLATGSVAIDMTGEDHVFSFAYDLRGVGYDRVSNTIVDYGCYEYQQITPPTPVTPLATPLFEAGNVASYGANRHSAVWGAVTNGVEYELAYSANGATDWTTIKTTELSTVVTNLTYGAQMSYKVRAIGDGVTYSDSEWSEALSLNVCPMDLDGDGRIGPADRTLLASAWLARPSSSNWDVRADIDGNNTVASGDRTFLTSNYLKAVTSTDLSYPPALAEAVFAEDIEVDDVDDFAVPTLDVDFDFFG